MKEKDLRKNCTCNTCTCDECDCTSKDEGYSYWSRKLQKPFDTLEALQAAEAKDAEQKAKQVAESNQKKVAAKKVEDALAELNTSRKTFNKIVVATKEEYLKKQAALKEEYYNTIKTLEKGLREKETDYTEALHEFTNKYGNNFHTTVRDGDFVTSVSISESQDAGEDSVDNFISTFFNNLKLW